MVRYAWIVAAATALFIAALPASAEFYKYRDKNGVLRFTDNLSEVPPDQRPNVSTYEGVQPARELPEKTAGEAAEAEAGGKDAAAAGAEEQQALEDVEAERSRLEQIKQQLDQERAELARRKEALVEERKRLETEREARAYNEKVQQLNDSISEYEKRRKSFQKQADALNAREE